MNYRTLLLLLVIAIVAATAAAFGANPMPVTLSWDQNPENQKISRYTIYELSEDGFLWRVVATITGNPPVNTYTIPSVEPGVHTYAVSASNDFWGESERSGSVATPVPAAAPRNFIIVVVGGGTQQ